ncbi:50S ribosomal protein L19 [Clostridium sp. CAG:914]|nr:50S ribosomal protein L19 [Clostridium sp.]CDE95816.1 50S ribosomal protein L19 [Clostridium sp. CAG:914]
MAKNLVEKVTEKQLKNDIPEFRVGNDVIVGCKIIETKNGKSRERIQNFEGTVIARKGHGVTETFTVRKISSGIGVERIFPVHSPNIAYIKVTKNGIVRRAKLYFLRTRKGQYKIKEGR